MCNLCPPILSMYSISFSQCNLIRNKYPEIFDFVRFEIEGDGRPANANTGELVGNVKNSEGKTALVHSIFRGRSEEKLLEVLVANVSFRR